MRKVILVVIFISGIIIYGKLPYNWPLKRSNGYSASFQEYRGNHFHAGIDIRTFQKTGFPVFAIDSGYVFKIRSVKRGSGRGIYLKHYDGNTSIYFHLKKFNKKIEKILTRYRKITNKKYFGNYLLMRPLHVKRGDLIGYSGETGSGFPHLHLEIRDSKNKALNPFKMIAFPSIDKRPPVISGIVFKSIGKTRINGINGEVILKPKINQNRQTDGLPVTVDGNFEIILGVHDISDTGRNVSPYSVKAYLNSKNIFKLKFDEFEWNDNNQLGYVYDMFFSSISNYFFNIFSQEGYDLPENGYSVKDIFNMLRRGDNVIKFEVRDNFNNISTYNLKIVRKEFEENSQISGNLEINEDMLNYYSSMEKIPSEIYINRDWISIKIKDKKIQKKDLVMRIIEGKEFRILPSNISDEGLYYSFSPSADMIERGLEIEFSLYHKKELCFISREKINLALLTKNREIKFRFNDFYAQFEPGSVNEKRLIMFDNMEIVSEMPVLSKPVKIYPYSFPYIGKVFFTFNGKTGNPKQAGIYKYSFKKKRWTYVYTFIDTSKNNFRTRQIHGGVFALLRDIYPPEIKILKSDSLKRSGIKKISIIVIDKGKGVEDENSKFIINGYSFKAEYDPDRKELICFNPRKKLKRGKNLIEVYVSDFGGNYSYKKFLLFLK